MTIAWFEMPTERRRGSSVAERGLRAFVPTTAEQRHSRKWCLYFRRNRARLLRIPWEKGAGLTDEQRRALLPSLQDFQLGESSDGVNGRQIARQYASRHADPEYAGAMDLFLAEEQRHGRDLGSYLDLAGVPRLRWSWTDFVFRFLRRGMGLEMLLMTALLAELIARVYYRAVLAASACPVLRTLCAQLLRDERRHVEFHVERLRLMRRHRRPWLRALVNGFHRVLYAGTCLAVWYKHGPALRLGGYPFRRFWRDSWRQFADAYRTIDAP
jgi:hypothetical protein